MRTASIHILLTRHFLRRFLENDLISPESDRTQLLAVIGAALVSTSLFVSFVTSFFSYASTAYTPGQLAVAVLNDRFFYISVSMVITALVAVTQWDSLAVDARDAAILGPLPVRPALIRCAKMSAIAILGLAAAALINLTPSLIFNWLLVSPLRELITLRSMLLLMIVHGAITFAAGVFAYLTIVGIRELLAVLFSARWLSILSPIVQGSLIVVLSSSLLLIPPASLRVERHGFQGVRAILPPTWFLGLYETMVGDVLASAPRGKLPLRQMREDAAATAAYSRHRAEFEALARRALNAFGLVAFATIAVYALNLRGFSAAAPMRSGRQRWSMAGALTRRLIVRNQTARAGFFFTLATIWRSNVHRLTLACAAAAGVAASVVALSGIDWQQSPNGGDISPRLLVVQPMLYGLLLVAFRHAIRVPVELRAHWGFQLAWRDDDRGFMSGVRRAAVVGIIAPVVVLLVPLFALFLGFPLAIAHAALGFAGAIVVLEALLIAYDKVPFTCTYVPNENTRAFSVIYVLTFSAGAMVFAGLEGVALRDSMSAMRLLLLLALSFVALRLISRRHRRIGPVDFDEAPSTAQRLDLNA